jgi:hypothetical protein
MANRSAAREISVLPIKQQRQDGGGDLKSSRTSDDRARLGRYLPPWRHWRSADYNAVRRSKSGINDAQALAKTACLHLSLLDDTIRSSNLNHAIRLIHRYGGIRNKKHLV